MKLHNLIKCQSLYLAGVFTTLPNLDFAGAFGLEVTIASLGIIACCGNCSGTYSGSTLMIRELRTVQLLFCLYYR